jgi:ethanolamine transporter EutH
MFKNTFELSTYISLILIGAYPTVLVIESKLDKRTE